MTDSDADRENLHVGRVRRAPELIRTQVATYLREAIADGRLRPGQQLIEREICAETTASRASVREAFRELEAQGLVFSEPGRGTIVAELTSDDACRYYELRAALEGVAAWRFALHASPKELEQLDSVVDGMVELAGDPALMLRAKDAFYHVLLRGAGNVELTNVLNQIRLRVNMARAKSLSAPGRPVESIAELRGIVEAARRRDPEEACRRCMQHVLNAAAAAVGEAAASTIAIPMFGSQVTREGTGGIPQADMSLSGATVERSSGEVD